MAASKWMKQVAQSKTPATPPGRSFLEITYTRKRGSIKSPSDTRIDIEINSGEAFVMF